MSLIDQYSKDLDSEDVESIIQRKLAEKEEQKREEKKTEEDEEESKEDISKLKKKLKEEKEEHLKHILSAQLFLVDVFKDVEELLFLFSKGKIGLNLMKKLFDISKRLLEYRTSVSRINQNLSPLERLNFTNFYKRFSTLLRAYIIPALAGNDQKLKTTLLNHLKHK